MKIYKLPEISYSFDNLFSLKPDSRSVVSIYDKLKDKHVEKTIFRSYVSYLNTPKMDTNIKKSYMFNNSSEILPNEFLPFLDFAKSIDSNFNQMVVNYYEKEDFIEPHRDCTSKFKNKEDNILVINLNESDTLPIRHMLFEAVDDNTSFSIPLVNNSYFFIENNLTHRHSVGTGECRRISITFRRINDESN